MRLVRSSAWRCAGRRWVLVSEQPATEVTTPPPPELITHCDHSNPIQGLAGHCPACHEAVWYADEGEHGPFWLCPADLDTRNPHHQFQPIAVSAALKAVNGTASNCWVMHSCRCPLEHMPMHSDCHGGSRPW